MGDGGEVYVALTGRRLDCGKAYKRVLGRFL